MRRTALGIDDPVRMDAPAGPGIAQNAALTVQEEQATRLRIRHAFAALVTGRRR